MRDFLQTQISAEAFNTCWEVAPPSFQVFLDVAAERLSVHACEADVAEFCAAIRPWGKNRVRVDGEFKTRDKNARSYYVEIVWLPNSNSYRGKASVWNTPPEIEPKSVDEFIAALDAITDEKTLILAAQAFLAVSGVDLEGEDLSRAYPTIFRLFERFPEEYFDSPDALISLLEERGGYEHELIESLLRVPSFPAVALAAHLTQTCATASERQRWATLLSEVADSSSAPMAVKQLAAREATR